MIGRKKILLGILMIGVQALVAHGQSIHTNRLFYVTSSDKDGTACVQGLPSDAPKYKASDRYAFDHWAYTWSGAVTGILSRLA